MDTGGIPRRKRCKRWDVELDAHCLTFSCFRRRPFLKSPRACRWFLDALDRARQRGLFDLWAFVLMPEHVHLVIRPGEDRRISAILTAIKLPVSNRVRMWVREKRPDFLDRMADRRPDGSVCHRFRQRGGGYDRNLRNNRDVYEKIHYIHDNPVRRGLIARPEDWPWSSFLAHAYRHGWPLALDLDSMPPPPVNR